MEEEPITSSLAPPPDLRDYRPKWGYDMPSRTPRGLECELGGKVW